MSGRDISITTVVVVVGAFLIVLASVYIVKGLQSRPWRAAGAASGHGALAHASGDPTTPSPSRGYVLQVQTGHSPDADADHGAGTGTAPSNVHVDVTGHTAGRSIGATAAGPSVV